VWSSRGLGRGRPAVLGAVGGGAAGERGRPGAAPVARSYGLHAEELDPGADPHGSGRHRPRIRTRRPESSSPPCAPPRAAAAVCGRARLRSPGPARRPLAPRRNASARARAAPPRPLRSAAPTWGGERGLRAVATSGGLATSVRVGVAGAGGTALGSAAAGSGAGGRGWERRRHGRDRERRGRGRGARGEGSGDGTERADGLNHDSRSRVNIWSDSIFGFVRVFGYRPSKPDLPEIISGTVTYYPK